jgi:hypothetical protein
MRTGERCGFVIPILGFLGRYQENKLSGIALLGSGLMYTDNELLYPNYVTSLLRDMRGDEWRKLIDHVVDLPDDHPDLLGFALMMIRLNGCMECETDSYRAMCGCAMCATQTLRRYKGPDRDLLDAYEKALVDVQAFLAEQDEAAWRVA